MEDDLIGDAPLFRGIEPARLPQLLSCLAARRVTYEKDGFLFRQGDRAGVIGLLYRGSVRLVREDVFGNRTIVGRAQTGDLFGEAFCCAGVATFPLDVVAETDCGVCFLDYPALVTPCDTVCGCHRTLLENMLRILAEKNVILSQKIGHLSKRSTREKLLSYLSLEAERTGGRRFSIPYDRQGLADFLCVERSAMSAELGKLRREGILQVQRNDFELLER